MKKFLFVALSICISVTFLGCTKNITTTAKESQESVNSVEESINGSEYITDKNKHLIGTEITQDGTDLQENNKQNQNLIPYKNIINTIDKKMNLYPSSINEFIVNEESGKYITPEIITTNGSISLFTKKDGTGWKLEKGQSLMFNFNKYESKSQNIIIGYITNGNMIAGDVFDNLSGSYKMTAKESGEYYLYVLNASSDYVALKEGNITIS